MLSSCWVCNWGTCAVHSTKKRCWLSCCCSSVMELKPGALGLIFVNPHNPLCTAKCLSHTPDNYSVCAIVLSHFAQFLLHIIKRVSTHYWVRMLGLIVTTDVRLMEWWCPVVPAQPLADNHLCTRSLVTGMKALVTSHLTWCVAFQLSPSFRRFCKMVFIIGVVLVPTL